MGRVSTLWIKGILKLIPEEDTTRSILPNWRIRLYSFSLVMTMLDAPVIRMTNSRTVSRTFFAIFILYLLACFGTDIYHFLNSMQSACLR